jgi:hypothetical protein
MDVIWSSEHAADVTPIPMEPTAAKQVGMGRRGPTLSNYSAEDAEVTYERQFAENSPSSSAS